jgi:NADH:ubiquinone oxidoreductase subunit 2 (subunit N)
VSFYYYIRFIRVMYLGDRIADDEPLSLSPALRAGLIVSVVLIVFIGVYPQPFIALAQKLIPAAPAVAPAAAAPVVSDNPGASQ